MGVPAGRLRLDGRIASVGFASGDRFVVGLWDDGPLGAMVDVMWARADGRRVLLAPTDEVAAWVSSLYRFGSVDVVPFEFDAAARRIDLRAGPVHLKLLAGRRIPVFVPRPTWFTRWVENPIARLALGVSTYGVTAGGQREWYQARSLRWILDARASVEGRDPGRWGPVSPAVGVGFSEPPSRPSLVRLRTVIES